jgi:CHAT domain-containing protein
MGVLASLWPVSDSKAAPLMAKFYELHLLDRLEPAEALWLAQRWLRNLPTWREDCCAAGALVAAEGPEASETVRELDLIRGENTVLDVEAAGEQAVSRDESILHPPQSHETDQIPGAAGQRQFWEDARHWAAFVIYGA